MTAFALIAPASPAPAIAPDPQAIGRAATLALYDELALTPKPGLVTLTHNGSHSDMNAHNSFDKPDALMPVKHAVERGGSKLSLALPPLSVVTVEAQLT